MKIAVCDDCLEDLQQMKVLLPGYDVSPYFRAEELLTDVEEKHMRFDLYLLDIYIQGSMNGIELAKKLRNLDPDAVLCFVSTSDGFYREAFDLYAIQYLLKPVKKENMNRLLERVSEKLLRDRGRKLSFKWKGETGMIPYGKILYISSQGHTLSIYCKDGTVQECTGKLNELEQQMRGDSFFRCHQSFLVNLHQVESLIGKDLIIANHRIPISRRYYEQVKNRYREILFEEVE